MIHRSSFNMTAEPTHVYLGEVKFKPWAAYVTLTCPTYANQADTLRPAIMAPPPHPHSLAISHQQPNLTQQACNFPLDNEQNTQIMFKILTIIVFIRFHKFYNIF